MLAIPREVKTLAMCVCAVGIANELCSTRLTLGQQLITTMLLTLVVQIGGKFKAALAEANGMVAARRATAGGARPSGGVFAELGELKKMRKAVD